MNIKSTLFCVEVCKDHTVLMYKLIAEFMLNYKVKHSKVKKREIHNEFPFFNCGCPLEHHTAFLFPHFFYIFNKFKIFLGTSTPYSKVSSDQHSVSTGHKCHSHKVL